MINKLYIRKNIQKNPSNYFHIILIITISIIIINILNIYMDAVYYGDELTRIRLGSLHLEPFIPQAQITLFNILKIIFTVVGVISIYFVYSIFIEYKKKDIGILISLGISVKQLKKLLFFELFIIYAISFFTALILSNVLMYFLIQNFLFVDNEHWVLIAYKFSFLSSLFLLFISFISIISSYTLCLDKIINIPVIQTIQNNFADKNIRRNANVMQKSSAIKYISTANILRNKKIFFISSLVSIPAICISIVFFNYFNLLNTPVERPDFVIVVDFMTIYDNAETVLENIELLNDISGIKDINFVTYYNNLLMEINENKLKFDSIHTVYCGDSAKVQDYYRMSLRVLEDSYFKSINNYELENHIVLSQNLDSSKYQAGDKIYLHDLSHTHHDEDDNIIIVAGFIDIPQQGETVNIFVTKENFEKITGYPAIPNIININIENHADSLLVVDKLIDIFYDKAFDDISEYSNLFTIIDNINDIEKEQAGESLYRGVTIIASFLCIVIFVSAVILLWSFISFYVLNQKQQIDILCTIGTTRKTIIKIVMHEFLARSVINVLTGLIIGTYISHIVIKRTEGYDFLINHYMFITYGVILFIAVSAHVIPALLTATKLINRGD